MSARVEYRSAPEIRASGRRLEGYAATFGKPAQIGPVRETIAPGAFQRSLAANTDILALLDHDDKSVLGRTKSGTLRLSEDTIGLAFSLDVPDTRAGNDVLTLAQRGDLGGMSFGFLVPEGGDEWNGLNRHLRAVDLKEISIVSAWPAYEGTSVALRKAAPRLALAKRWMQTL
jgi:hypothetical protein